jgi:hypothetical protein
VYVVFRCVGLAYSYVTTVCGPPSGWRLYLRPPSPSTTMLSQAGTPAVAAVVEKITSAPAGGGIDPATAAAAAGDVARRRAAAVAAAVERVPADGQPAARLVDGRFIVCGVRVNLSGFVVGDVRDAIASAAVEMDGTVTSFVSMCRIVS